RRAPARGGNPADVGRGTAWATARVPLRTRHHRIREGSGTVRAPHPARRALGAAGLRAAHRRRRRSFAGVRPEMLGLSVGPRAAHWLLAPAGKLSTRAVRWALGGVDKSKRLPEDFAAAHA